MIKKKQIHKIRKESKIKQISFPFKIIPSLPLRSSIPYQFYYPLTSVHYQIRVIAACNVSRLFIVCDNIDIFWPDARQEKKIGWRSGRASYPIGERIISEKAAGKPNSFEKAVSDRNTNLSLSLSYSFSLPLLPWRVQVATTCAALARRFIVHLRSFRLRKAVWYIPRHVRFINVNGRRDARCSQ